MRTVAGGEKEWRLVWRRASSINSAEAVRLGTTVQQRIRVFVLPRRWWVTGERDRKTPLQ